MMWAKSWQTPWRDVRLTSIGEFTAVLFFTYVERAIDPGGDVADAASADRGRPARRRRARAPARSSCGLGRAYWLGISIGQ